MNRKVCLPWWAFVLIGFLGAMVHDFFWHR
jgi:hypothetical protein